MFVTMTLQPALWHMAGSTAAAREPTGRLRPTTRVAEPSEAHPRMSSGGVLSPGFAAGGSARGEVCPPWPEVLRASAVYRAHDLVAPLLVALLQEVPVQQLHHLGSSALIIIIILIIIVINVNRCIITYSNYSR